MAFRKFAKAQVVHPNINLVGWEAVRGGSPQLKTAAKVVLQEYDPQAFMLTHCTIIASVDTVKSSAPLGKSMVDGFQVTRKYADWKVSAATQKYINNNFDCWERKLLLSSFRTFIGGENYVEHIQIPELSKGKIIDTAARDIGDSIYVDILVATERKHKPLITAITSGQLQTLSMGCQVEFTTCTKCGNVAYDETELCNHIRFFKGSEYVDPEGINQRIAELCGHIEEEPGSVKFIEASWVANPAFPGAVLRSILSPEEISSITQKMSFAFAQPIRFDMPGMSKAARSLFGTQEDAGQSDQGDQAQQGSGTGMGDVGQPKPEANPMDKAVDDLASDIRERALAKVRKDMSQGESDASSLNENTNTTLIKDAFKHASWRNIYKTVLGMTKGDLGITHRLFLGMIHYKSGGWGAVTASKVLSGRDMLALGRMLDLFGNRRATIAGENRLYRAVVQVGGMAKHQNEQAYLSACRRVVGRDLTPLEKKLLVSRGRLFSMGS